MKHTPAPWKVGETNLGDTLAVYGNGIRIADMAGSVNPKYAFAPDEVRANARLIAAAPELLEALKELVAEWDMKTEELCQQPGIIGRRDTGGILLARAAIAKAEAE